MTVAEGGEGVGTERSGGEREVGGEGTVVLGAEGCEERGVGREGGEEGEEGEGGAGAMADL